MDENYIPGFTNELYSSSGMTPYGDYYYDPSMYSDAMVSPYGRMGGDYYEPIDYYDPSMYSEPSYGIDPYGRMAGEQVGMPQAVEPMGGLDIMGGGGSDMTLARPGALYGTSTASPYSKPSLTPSLDFVTNNGQQGYYFVTNAGKRAKTKANPTAFVAVDPNAQYRLVNERGKNTIVASGTGEQGLRDAYAMAQQLSAQGGKKADWYLERSDPNGNWTRIADDDPKGSDLGTFGKVLGAALPIATAFIPGLGPLASIAVQAASGAAGSALAGGDPLKGAVIGGLTAGGGALGNSLSAGLGVSSKLGTALGTGLGSTAGNLVTGQSLKNSLLSGVTSGGLSYIAPSVLNELGIKTGPSSTTTDGGGGGGTSGSWDGSTIGVTGLRAPAISPSVNLGGFLPSSPKPTPEPTPEPPNLNEILVTGSRTPTVTSTSGVSVPISTGGVWGDPYTAKPLPSEPLPTDPADLEEILVTARPTTNIGAPISFGNSSPTGSLSDPAFTNPIPSELLPPDEPLDYEEILVNATPPTVGTPISLGNNSPTGSLSDPAYKNPWPTEQPTQPEENNTLKDIADYLRLAGLASTALGGLFGGGGGGSGQKFNLPGGMGALSSVFTSKLPPANIPGGVGTGGTGARPAADLAVQGLRDPKDYYRYGYGPEQSFFNYVPQGAPNTSQAYTGYAEGGYAVGGPGDGRDDKIPALLSDGEYVVDAETVALLGNGSNKAGAEMLDKFRVNLRKQKGRKLARGEFSADAKRPENYMAGRLT